MAEDMNLPGPLVIPAPSRKIARAPVCRVVDTSSVTTSLLRAELRKLGYVGVIRTVPLPGNSSTLDISPGELDAILSEGMGSWWYQHPRLPGWRPGACDPEADALYAVKFAKAAGYAPGTHGFADAEGMSALTTESEAILYYRAYCHVLVTEGFSAGIYAGYDDAMNAVDLYEIPDATSYWSDAAKRKVATRGTAVGQEPEVKIMGVPIDPSVIAPDLKGETPFWTVAS
jgi:Domain of unknown function (DUF1906)